MKKAIEEFSGQNLYGDSVSFHTVHYRFEFEHDAEWLKQVYHRGIELMHAVHSGAANESNRDRSKRKIEIDCVAGILAEQCWKNYLNKMAGEKRITETEFRGAATQIDLKIKGTDKKIEVRSSFPRNGIQFAIFNTRYQFDILGPYDNRVKKGEVQKDFYVRVLYPFDANIFFEKFKGTLDVYLTGGATWAMMQDKRYYKIKDLTERNMSLSEYEKSTYRVIPMSLALDTPQIAEMILNG